MDRFGFLTVTTILAALSLTSCGGDAYVRPPGGLDRDHPSFGKTSAEVGRVVICYSKFQTGQGELTEMARAECAKGGLIARYQGEDRSTCPLATPIAIKFQCVSPSASSSGSR